MRKLLFLCAICVAFTLQTQAQKCFEKGNVLLNPGLGFGSNYNGYNAGFNPSFFFSADFGVHDYVSVGPYAGGTFFGNKVNAFDFGGRGNFHWWQLMDDKVSKDLKQEQMEMYFTLWLGYEFVKFSNGSVGDFDIGSTLGLRWYPKGNERFALYGEWGYTPIAWSVLGCTIKIR